MLELLLKIIQHNLKLLENNSPCLTHPELRSSSSSTFFTSDWANLPEDILDEIIKKMSYVDYSTFRSVCKSWGYIDRFCCLPRNIPFGIPLLLLNAYKSDSNLHKFAKMNGEITSNNIFMPEATNKRVCGSSWGWLILQGTDSREVSLLNPFVRRVIHLPSFDTYTVERNGSVNDFNYIYKAILSTNPAISEQDCIIMAIVGQMGKLSYCKIGDKKWTNVDCRILEELCDIIYYNGKFYATTEYGDLVSCDIIHPNFTKTIASAPPSDYKYSSTKYLVMASERLLLVYITNKERFKIHLLKKCNPFAIYHDHQYKWVEINSIGEELLFIGNNGSFSIPGRRHNSGANCIYFTEDAFGLVISVCCNNNSVGMYDIAKKKLSMPPHLDEVCRSSFWMIPSPW